VPKLTFPHKPYVTTLRATGLWQCTLPDGYQHPGGTHVSVWFGRQREEWSCMQSEGTVCDMPVAVRPPVRPSVRPSLCLRFSCRKHVRFQPSDNDDGKVATLIKGHDVMTVTFWHYKRRQHITLCWRHKRRQHITSPTCKEGVSPLTTVPSLPHVSSPKLFRTSVHTSVHIRANKIWKLQPATTVSIHRLSADLLLTS
jgi:hypothetical protein